MASTSKSKKGMFLPSILFILYKLFHILHLLRSLSYMNVNDIELEPMSVKTSSKQAQDLMEEDTIQPTRITPLLLQTKLEEDLGIDFSSYDKFKQKQHRSRKQSNKLEEIVQNACWKCFPYIINAPGF